MKEYRLERYDRRDLRFTGDLLGAGACVDNTIDRSTAVALYRTVASTYVLAVEEMWTQPPGATAKKWTWQFADAKALANGLGNLLQWNQACKLAWAEAVNSDPALKALECEDIA